MKRGEVYDARLDQSKGLNSADHGPSWLSVAMRSMNPVQW